MKKKNNQIKVMALTKYINKSSNVISFNKFINKYKNILNSKFNKFIEDNFEISFDEYLLIIVELGIINNNYKLFFKKEKEKEKSNGLNFTKFNEKQNSISLWKDKNILTNINNNIVSSNIKEMKMIYNIKIKLNIN